ncbi:hypothetical protein [Priestia aryabhattai]
MFLEEKISSSTGEKKNILKMKKENNKYEYEYVFENRVGFG